MQKLFSNLKNSSWLFAGVLLVCFLVSAGIRYQQFETWKKNPATYFVAERPMMTTLDAPYWLRLAREYNDNIFKQKRGLREYPETTATFEEMSFPKKYRDPPPLTTSTFQAPTSGTSEIRYRDVPLLSFLIAHLYTFFNYNYYLTGTLLIPVLASLFILPLGIYFFQIGIPVSGLLGGLIGTFAGGYFMRSSIGRIDTDMLNLFFPSLAALLILLASLAKSDRSVLLYSISAGLSLFLFQWWYDKAGFTLAFFIVLVISLFIQYIRFQTILMCSLLFVLCVDPGTFLKSTGAIKDFLQNYFVIEEAATSAVIDNGMTSAATFPNVFGTISEVDKVSMDEVFQRIISNPMIGWAGFLTFFALAVFRWRVLLPVVPMLILGLLSFQSSNRFIMYLAPFIWIGLGWLLQLGVEAIFLLFAKNFNNREDKEIKGKSKAVKGERLKVKGSRWDGSEISWWNWSRQGVLYLGMGVFFWMISGQTAISFVPGPSIHSRLYSTFLEVKKQVPENSALLTWWDYGYAITDATGLATFHDGSSQFSPKTYFVARSLISPDQDELYDITQYLATEGNRGIVENNTSPKALLKAVRNPEHKPWDPIYLFFTADMTGKYGAISKLGSWDIVKGGSQPKVYQNLACNKITNEEMNCRGAKIDFKAGLINNQLALRRLLFIRNGQVLRDQNFGHAQGFTLQLIMAGKNIVEVQLIDEAVFLSNYNQMFLLGRYRKDLFEEAYNAFPFSRLFRVKF